MSNQYFATKPTNELAKELMERVTEWEQYLESSGLKARWEKSYKLYFGKHFKLGGLGGLGVQRAGEDGELSLVSVNHYRNLIKHVLIMCTSQKPSFDVRAINADSESLQQARLGGNILDFYLKEKRLGRYIKTAVEHALVFGKGFIKCTWEPSLGRPYSVEEYQDGEEIKERMIYEGDISVANPDPLGVFGDLSEEDWSKSQWQNVRSFRNKYDLAARYPDQSAKILELEGKGEIENNNYGGGISHLNESALIPVYEFYHKRSDSLPNGRYTLYASDDCVLYDGPIPYENLPVFRIVPGEIWGTTEGYTDSFDIVGIQEAFNTALSIAFSNLNAHGLQHVLIPNGSNVSVEQLSQNLSAIKYNPIGPNGGKPEALQLTALPQGIFDILSLLKGSMETISGVNSVARGDPEHSLKSGVALGLVQSMAVQFASGIQQSWAELLEDVGTFILKLLKDFAKTERMIAIAGKSNRGSMEKFTGDKLNRVDRAVIDLGNPMSRTIAGRTELADNLLQKGLIKTPQEYITVMQTGQIEPAIKSTQSQLGLIHAENEDLAQGKPVRALAVDAHLLHMQEHACLFDSPEVRNNGQMLQVVLDHYMEHKNLYQTQDPLFAQINGEPPFMGGAPTPPLPGGPEGSAPGPAPEGPPMPMPGGEPPLPDLEGMPGHGPAPAPQMM
jgi:hypothetical protein